MPKWMKWPSAEKIGRWLLAVGGRRFALTLFVQISSTWLAAKGLIDGSIYRDITLGTSAVFIGSNTYESVKQNAGKTTVEVAEITGEAPITVDGTGAPIKVELSTKEGDTLGR